MRIIFPFLLLLAITTSAQQTYVNLNAIDFKQKIEAKNAILLDTRTVGEYERGHIKNAQLIDLQDKNIAAVLLAFPKTSQLYLYCYSGARSKMVADFLVQNGYTNVYNLQRGIIDWNNNGFELVAGNIAKTTGTEGKTQSDFSNIIQTNSLVFFDFYAPWCAPCKQMMPMINELTNEYNGKVLIVKVNTDESKELMLQLKIPAVPHFIMYKNGKQIFAKSGVLTKEEIKLLFNNNL